MWLQRAIITRRGPHQQTLRDYWTVSGETVSDIAAGLSVRNTVNCSDLPVFTALYTSADDVTAIPLIAVITSPERTPPLHSHHNISLHHSVFIALHCILFLVLYCFAVQCKSRKSPQLNLNLVSLTLGLTNKVLPMQKQHIFSHRMLFSQTDLF